MTYKKVHTIVSFKIVLDIFIRYINPYGADGNYSDFCVTFHLLHSFFEETFSTCAHFSRSHKLLTGPLFACYFD